MQPTLRMAHLVVGALALGLFALFGGVMLHVLAFLQQWRAAR